MNTTFIHFRSDDGTTHEFAIEKSVVRVGFGAAYDVALPSNSSRTDLVATLRKDPESGWRVYNRCRDNLWIDKRALAPNGQSGWERGQMLAIDETMTLQLGAGPARSVDLARSVNSIQEVSDHPNHEREIAERVGAKPSSVAAPAKKSNAGPVAAIVICGLLVAMMGLAKSGGSKENSNASPDITQVLELAEFTDDEDAKFLAAKLQIAQASMVRGDLHTAEQRFSELREFLSRNRTRFEREQAELELEATRFVEYQLGLLR